MSNSQSAGKLTGKVAVITGGATGIGFATAKLFLQEGAFVYITGRRPESLDNAVRQLNSSEVRAIAGDVSKLADLNHLYSIIKAEKGRIDILFANAGLGTTSPVEKITEEDFDKIFGINVKGLIFTVQKALPLIPEGGSIILNSSIAGFKGFPGLLVYSATKGAVRNIARSLAAELGPRKIRVNAVSPGQVPTDGWTTVGMPTEGEAFDRLLEHVAPMIPAGRVGKPEEIASVALFLASDDSSYVNGIDLVADGGLTQI